MEDNFLREKLSYIGKVVAILSTHEGQSWTWQCAEDKVLVKSGKAGKGIVKHAGGFFIQLKTDNA